MDIVSKQESFLRIRKEKDWPGFRGILVGAKCLTQKHNTATLAEMKPVNFT